VGLIAWTWFALPLSRRLEGDDESGPDR